VWTFPTGQEIMRFHYGSIELAALEGQALLDLGFPGLLPLLPSLTLFGKLGINSGTGDSKKRGV
jgi:hypothetical protein